MRVLALCSEEGCDYQCGGYEAYLLNTPSTLKNLLISLSCVSRLWTDEDNRKLVLDHYPWFLDTYDALPKPVMKADSVRYLYMHHLGGESHATACSPMCIVSPTPVSTAISGAYWSRVHSFSRHGIARYGLGSTTGSMGIGWYCTVTCIEALWAKSMSRN